MSFRIYKSNPVNKVENTGIGTTIAQKQNDVLYVKTLEEGSGVSLVDTGDSIIINASGGITDVINTGTGLELAQKSGSDILVQTLKAGSNVSLAQDATSITISSTGGGGGIVGNVQTTNAFPTTLLMVATVIDTAYVVDVIVIGANTTNNNANAFFLKGGYKNIGGVLTELTVVEDKLSEIQDITTDATLGILGTSILVQVQGVAGNIINWTGELRFQPSSF